MFNKWIISILLMLCFTTSCSKDAIVMTNDFKMKQISNSGDQSYEMQQFASVLSKSIYQNKNLRKLLKEKAIQRFDYNYDVIYYPIRNEKISEDKTVRDILVSNSSEDFIAKIENNIPLLNIFIPKISDLKVYPETLNVDEYELPVAVNGIEGTYLYLNGKKVNILKEGEVPGFNVIVVNKNIRVNASESVGNRSDKSEKWTYHFKNDNFDNTQLKTRTNTEPRYLYQKAKRAYNIGFNKDDNSDEQMAHQRDYIYYAITPTNKEGVLNKSVQEYLSFIEVEPRLYYRISEQNAVWTRGAYNFIFQVSTSTSQNPIKIVIPVNPEDIWDFHISEQYRRLIMLRHARRIYKINQRRFTSKKFYLNPTTASIGKWNIANEGLERYISIYEGDDTMVKKQIKTKTSFSHAYSSTFNGDLKLGIGLSESKSSATIGIGGSTTNSNNETFSLEVFITKKEYAGMIGEYIPIYFYDPIIVGKDYAGNYIYNEYNTGGFRFGIDAR